jgi:hypothetical protein
MNEWHKIVLNGITTIAWIVGIAISVMAVAKGRKMKDIGVSYKTYLSLVATTEVFYTVGAVMILSAMGVNVLQHLARLDLWKFYQVISNIDMTTIKIIGVVGWVGFVVNRGISFMSPGYLLVKGGKKLPKYFWYSAWAEVILEVITTILIFVTLKFG